MMDSFVKIVFLILALYRYTYVNALSVEDRLLIFEEKLLEKDERVAKLEENVREHGDHISNLEEVVSNQRWHITKLEDVLREQRLYIEAIENRIDNNDFVFEPYGDTKIDVEAKRKRDTSHIFWGNVPNAGARLSRLETELDSFKGESIRRECKGTKRVGKLYEKDNFAPSVPNQSKIAFYAEQRMTTNYSFHETIRFTEILDVGGGFNTNDSIFTAPVSGVYVFTWNIVNDHHTYIQVQLMANGVVKCQSVSDSEGLMDIDPSSGTIVLLVNRGEHVLLRRGAATSGVIRVDETWGTVMFAGWLLFE